MAVIMKKFCLVVDLKIGTVIVAALSMIGCCIVFGRFIFLAVSWTKEEPLIRGRNYSHHYSNRTIEHWEDTILMDYSTIGLYTVCFLVSACVIYGVLFIKTTKITRAILFMYMACTVMALPWSLAGFIYFYIDGATVSVVLALMVAVSIYFFLVVFSYERQLKQKRGRHDQLAVSYTQFANEPMTDDTNEQRPSTI